MNIGEERRMLTFEPLDEPSRPFDATIPDRAKDLVDAEAEREWSDMDVPQAQPI
jgi:hypothetical protein